MERTVSGAGTPESESLLRTIRQLESPKPGGKPCRFQGACR